MQKVILTVDLALEPKVELNWKQNIFLLNIVNDRSINLDSEYYFYLQCTLKETRLLIDGGTSLLAMQK